MMNGDALQIFPFATDAGKNTECLSWLWCPGVCLPLMRANHLSDPMFFCYNRTFGTGLICLMLMN